jgi:lactate dehydrogenase-like 2-hydroxyacid dehydrogenase
MNLQAFLMNFAFYDMPNNKKLITDPKYILYMRSMLPLHLKQMDMIVVYLPLELSYIWQMEFM